MQHIRVDVRGRCGNPTWKAPEIVPDGKTLANEKTNLTGGYLFTVAIENSLEHDYVTEKLWQPLAAGSVPLYLGAPNIAEWAPCGNCSCLIDLRQFGSMAQLAAYLHWLVDNRDEYVRFHRWRTDDDVRPAFLRMVEYFRRANEHSVECLVCDMTHRRDHGLIRRRLLAADDPFQHPFPLLL
jgi:hypothetical protein